MKLIVGFLTLIGLAVVLVFLAAIGLFAFDEVKRKMAEGDFSSVMPPASEPEQPAAESQSG